MHSNPFQPPRDLSTAGAPVTREQVSLEIRAYLAKQVNDGDLIVRLESYCKSDDACVAFVANELLDGLDGEWPYPVNEWEKYDWDFVQRLLLLLESNCELSVSKSCQTNWTQLVAAIGVLFFAISALQLGWGWQLLWASAPAGMLALILQKTRERQEAASDWPNQSIIQPFATFTDLSQAYHSATFEKDKFPKTPSESLASEDSKLLEFVAAAQILGAWIMFSPLILLAHCFPDRIQTVKAHFVLKR